jgi:hypothetical protein
VPIDATKVESPGWWLQRLGKKLLDERPTVSTATARGAGPRHPEAVRGEQSAAPARAWRRPREVAEWMKDARTNWTSLVIDSPTERLHVDGFRFGE